MSVQKVVKAIKKYSQFIITSHIGLEGDALGSELALASLLHKLGKKAYVINSDEVPMNYTFLPGAQNVYQLSRHKKGLVELRNRTGQRLNSKALQVLCIIDCADKNRAGKVLDLIKEKYIVINIDHHMGNKKFGTINWVDPQASSTGEMVYHLFKLLHVQIDKEDALNIYTAILTDTGSFRYSNTTSMAFYICDRLLKLGLEPAKIYANIYENNSLQDVNLIRKIISRLSFAANNKIVWVNINRAEFKKIKNRPGIKDEILDFAKLVAVVKVVIIFLQIEKRLIKVSLRSRSPIDVQKVALKFGGGGHKFASGCTINASLKQAKRVILEQVKRALSR
jgi:phosphoesterase RecJ-like protein